MMEYDLYTIKLV